MAYTPPTAGSITVILEPGYMPPAIGGIATSMEDVADQLNASGFIEDIRCKISSSGESLLPLACGDISFNAPKEFISSAGSSSFALCRIAEKKTSIAGEASNSIYCFGGFFSSIARVSGTGVGNVLVSANIRGEVHNVSSCGWVTFAGDGRITNRQEVAANGNITPTVVASGKVYPEIEKIRSLATLTTPTVCRTIQTLPNISGNAMVTILGDGRVQPLRECFMANISRPAEVLAFNRTAKTRTDFPPPAISEIFSFKRA